MSDEERDYWQWSKKIPHGSEEEWLEKLTTEHPGTFLIVSPEKTKRPHIELFSENLEGLQEWEKRFGGQLRLFSPPPYQSSQLSPIHVGRRFVCVATSKQKREIAQSLPQTTILEIPAGMAFGTGDHATTGMVLREMKNLPRNKKKNRSVLDSGTGSGILALAARVEGASKIVAMDNDAHAIRTAQENERRNFASSVIDWQQASLETFEPPHPFDLITANLYSDCLIAHASQFYTWLVPGGTLLMSGILSSQEIAVTQVFSQIGLSQKIRKRRGKWVMMRWEKE